MYLVISCVPNAILFYLGNVFDESTSINVEKELVQASIGLAITLEHDFKALPF